MQRQIEELRRKAEQGSQQLQGEVQELELESLLGSAFVYDSITRVPKGEFGGDVLHRVVMNQTGAVCGTILWEFALHTGGHPPACQDLGGRAHIRVPSHTQRMQFHKTVA
jgi:hypothetical protein